MLAYEYVPTESPYLFEVTPFACGSPHQVSMRAYVCIVHNGLFFFQAIGVLPKVLCNVERVEVLRGVRLTKSSVEQFTIRVPRTRLEYFQDDVYPATLAVWESALSTQEWLSGNNSVQHRVNMQPQGMKPCQPNLNISTAYFIQFLYSE